MTVLSVTEFTRQIKYLLETKFPLISIQGEVTNVKKQASGHIYFQLKDEQAQISAVLFRGQAVQISHLPKSGDQIVIKGGLNIYPPRGNYQIIVREIENVGVGALLIKLHDLKEKLLKKGWFDPKKKKSLPKYPQTIGVITSPTGAVIQDIIHVLSRRCSGFHLILFPVRVQGEEASYEIAQAIQECNRYNLADILIVGRGGGSLEELWPFNEETVANAIFHSHIPLISAVGHETDHCIADYVADVRAPTPSAAAEIATNERVKAEDRLKQIKTLLSQAMITMLREKKTKIHGITQQPLFASPLSLLGSHYQKFDDLSEHLNQSFRSRLLHCKTRLAGVKKALCSLNPTLQTTALKEKSTRYQKQLQDSLLYQIKAKKERLQRLIAHIQSVSPKNILRKGYCIPFLENTDSVIISAKELKRDQQVSLLFHDGKATTSIKNVET